MNRFTFVVALACAAFSALSLEPVTTSAQPADAIGKPLRQLPLSPDWMIAAISHDTSVRVPTADDFVHAGDALMLIGRHGKEAKLKQVFGVK